MSPKLKWRIVQVAMLWGIDLAVVAHGSIVLDGNPTAIAASASFNGGDASAWILIRTLPYTHSYSVAIGGNSDTTTASLTQTGFSEVFDNTRSGAVGCSAGAGMIAYFHVTVDSLYNVTGNYAVQDVNLSGDSFFFVELIDKTTTPLVFFDSFSESRQTANPQFTVEQPTGDYALGTFTHGSQKGTLLVGHNYEFIFEAFTQSLTVNQGGRGMGGMTFDVTPIPEPGSMVLVAATAAMLASRSRRAIDK